MTEPTTPCREPAYSAAEGGMQVYFIAGGGKTKVGISRDPAKRLATIVAHSPEPDLRVVYAEPGGQALERAVHEYLDPRHSHGEWFHGEMTAEEAELALAAARSETTALGPAGRRGVRDRLRGLARSIREERDYREAAEWLAEIERVAPTSAGNARFFRAMWRELALEASLRLPQPLPSDIQAVADG